ncbi:hypothetical protein B0H13DRAFT_1873231 [Mycena leptocephala]|nr:hypothetical protein B0H13DRAFT_1873231 [Mycena leptocephala]
MVGPASEIILVTCEVFGPDSPALFDFADGLPAHITAWGGAQGNLLPCPAVLSKDSIQYTVTWIPGNGRAFHAGARGYTRRREIDKHSLPREFLDSFARWCPFIWPVDLDREAPGIQIFETFCSMGYAVHSRNHWFATISGEFRQTIDVSPLSGVATFGGFWTFLNGAFALIFGANVVYFAFGRRPLSALGVIHLFQRRKLTRQWHANFPALQTEGGLPGSESTGIVAFIRERLIDVGDHPRVQMDDPNDLEAQTAEMASKSSGSSLTVDGECTVHEMQFKSGMVDQDSVTAGTQYHPNTDNLTDFSMEKDVQTKPKIRWRLFEVLAA